MGEPVARAEIWVEGGRQPYGRAWPLAATAADGRFLVLGLGPHARLGARASGHLASALRKVAQLEENARGLREARLELGEPGGGVDGRVLDAEGEPLAGAQVKIGPKGGHIVELPSGATAEAAIPVPVWTDARGEFRYPGDLPIGPQPVRVIARGQPLWSGTVEIRSGQRSWLEIQLARPARIVGRVVTRDGSPVEGVRVKAARETGGGWYDRSVPPCQSDSDAQGRFELDWLAPGEQELNAFDYLRPRLGRAQARVTCIAGSLREVELVLELGHTLRGRVVDGEGRPLAGWRVRGEPQSFEAVYPRRDETDEKGEFLLANLGDCPWVIEVHAPSLTEPEPRAKSEALAVGAEDVLLVVPTATSEAARLHGRLVESSGSIPVHAQLTLWAEHGDTGTFVDFDPQDGSFTAEVGLPGRYLLRALQGGRTLSEAGPFEVAAGEELEVGHLEIGALGRVEIMFTGLDDEARARLQPSLSRPGEWEVPAFEDGLHRSAEIAPGEWTLRLDGRWFAPDTTVDVPAGQTLRLELEVRAAFEVAVEITVDRPEALGPGAFVEIRDAREAVVRRYGPRSPSEEVQGGIRLWGLTLPAGEYSVEAWTESGLRGKGRIHVDPQFGRALEEVIVLR